MNIKIIICIVAIALIAGAAVVFSSLPQPVSYTGFALDYFTELNALRTQHGLKPYVQNAQLDAAAKAQVESMIAQDYAGYTAPDGTTNTERVQDAGYDMQYFIGASIGRKYKNAADFLSDRENPLINDPYIGSTVATQIGIYAQQIATGYVVVAEYGGK